MPSVNPALVEAAREAIALNRPLDYSPEQFQIVHVSTQSVLSAGPFDSKTQAHTFLVETYPRHVHEYVVRSYFQHTLGI